MPRRRHDTSDDSDASSDDVATSRRRSGVSKDKKRRRSSSHSSEKTNKRNSKKVTNDSDSDSDSSVPDTPPPKKKSKQKSSSFKAKSDSPLKKSVVSKVHKDQGKKDDSVEKKEKVGGRRETRLSDNSESSPEKRRVRGRNDSSEMAGKGVGRNRGRGWRRTPSPPTSRPLLDDRPLRRDARRDVPYPTRDIPDLRDLVIRSPLRLAQPLRSPDRGFGRYPSVSNDTGFERDDTWRSPERNRFPNMTSRQRFEERYYQKLEAREAEQRTRQFDRSGYRARSFERQLPPRDVDSFAGGDRMRFRERSLSPRDRFRPRQRNDSFRSDEQGRFEGIDRVRDWSPEMQGNPRGQRDLRNRSLSPEDARGRNIKQKRISSPLRLDRGRQNRSASAGRGERGQNRSVSLEQGNIRGRGNRSVSRGEQQGGNSNRGRSQQGEGSDRGKSRQGESSDRGKSRQGESSDRGKSRQGESSDRGKSRQDDSSDRGRSNKNSNRSRSKERDGTGNKTKPRKRNDCSDEEVVSKKSQGSAEKGSKKKDKSAKKGKGKNREISNDSAVEKSKNLSSHSNEESPEKSKAGAKKTKKQSKLVKAKRSSSSESDPMTAMTSKRSKDEDNRSRSKSLENLKFVRKKGKTTPKGDKAVQEKPRSRSRSPSADKSNNLSPKKKSTKISKSSKGAKERKSRSRSPKVRSLSPRSPIRSEKSVVKGGSNEVTAARSRDRSVGRNEVTAAKSCDRSVGRNEVTAAKSRDRSVGRNEVTAARSRDRSVGRNHDMAQFQSEPESGELTDSGEEEADPAAGKLAIKSTINVKSTPAVKSTSVDRDTMDDDAYWREKRKASQQAEQALMGGAKETGRGGAKESGKGGATEAGKDRGSKSSRKRHGEDQPGTPTKQPDEATAAVKKPRLDASADTFTGKTGGAYIPPARLRAMQANITDKTSVAYQRLSWEALKKSINGLVNKVNVSNIENIVRELFQENIVRGRGLMARSIVQAQAASPTFTHVYAALVAVVNTKFPQNGELILRRLIIQFRRGFKRNNKTICVTATKFIAHLINQQVAHEILALEILTLLLETPTDDSVEVTISLLKECGQKLTEVSPRGINAIFERLRNILHEGQIDTRVQYMVEVMFAVRKDHFKDYPSLVEDLDLVEEEDQFTHLLTLEEAGDPEDMLNIFRPDPDFGEAEDKYRILKKEILDEGSSDEDGSGSGSGSDDDDDDSDNEEDEEAKQKIIDLTETNMVALRRTIYLSIQSSLDFEECAHKLLKMELKPGQEVELCSMILDCCAQTRTYEKFYGLLAGRFCMIDKKYVEPFQNMFKEQYDTIHRLETNKLRNVAKFFAHLLHTDSVSWAVLSCIRLNEEDTTSASRIFIKILFQELSEFLGLPKLNVRLKDVSLQEYFTGILPRDNPRDTRFAINFFTTIGLGGLTDDLRDHLKSVSKKLMQQKQEEQQQAAESDSSDESSDQDEEDSDSDTSEEDSDSSDSSDDSISSNERKRKKRKEPVKEKERKKDGKAKKHEQEVERVEEKNRRDKGREKSNGSLDKNLSKKEKKRKDAEKKREEEMEKEKAKQFARLSKLANYGNIDKDQLDKDLERLGTGGKRDKDEKRSKKKRRKDKEDRRRDSYGEGNGRDTDMVDQDGLMDRMGDRFRDDLPMQRNYDGGMMEDRRDDRPRGRDGRRGRKDREFAEDDRNDQPITIERNFERLDVYEDKFDRDRERNMEFVRGRPEYKDYYRGRPEADQERGVGGYRDGGRRGDFEDDRLGGRYPDREMDRGFGDGRGRRDRRDRRGDEDMGPPPRVEERRRRR